MLDTGKSVLAAGWCDDETPCRSFKLEPGERIVGVMAHYVPANSPSLFDPIFVIGRFE